MLARRGEFFPFYFSKCFYDCINQIWHTCLWWQCMYVYPMPSSLDILQIKSKAIEYLVDSQYYGETFGHRNNAQHPVLDGHLVCLLALKKSKQFCWRWHLECFALSHQTSGGNVTYSCSTSQTSLEDLKYFYLFLCTRFSLRKISIFLFSISFFISC